MYEFSHSQFKHFIQKIHVAPACRSTRNFMLFDFYFIAVAPWFFKNIFAASSSGLAGPVEFAIVVNCR